MNRNLILIAIAAVAIAGIGVGLLLPALLSGPLTGVIAPIPTIAPLTTQPTPTPAPPVVITITGSYSPYRTWNESLKSYDWYLNLSSVTTYDASTIPSG